jgi:nitrate/nitrite-specific signal transduction histidine kinase
MLEMEAKQDNRAFPRLVTEIGDVLVHGKDKAVRLTVEDDGIGIEADASKQGMGSSIIEKLAQCLKAKLTVLPATQDIKRPGTGVELLIPMA